MSRAKTTAQWRREVPAYDKACTAAGDFQQAGQPTYLIAHIHPDTRVVSFVLRGTDTRMPAFDRMLAARGYRTGGCVAEEWAGVTCWRKVVAR